MAVISTTPPASPATGLKWWDGGVMHVFDGMMWRTVGPGGSAGPVPTTVKTFSITQLTTLSLGAATWAIVPFAATPMLDGFAGWNATTHKYQPTRAGMYEFFIRGYMYAPAGGWNGIILYRNDTGAIASSFDAIADSTIYGAGGSALVTNAAGIAYLNGTTDYVRLWAYATDGNFLTQNFPNIEAYLLP